MITDEHHEGFTQIFTKSHKNSYIIQLRNGYRSCRKWKFLHFLCSHAIVVICYIDCDVSHYVSPHNITSECACTWQHLWDELSDIDECTPIKDHYYIPSFWFDRALFFS